MMFFLFSFHFQLRLLDLLNLTNILFVILTLGCVMVVLPDNKVAIAALLGAAAHTDVSVNTTHPSITQIGLDLNTLEVSNKPIFKLSKTA